MFFIRHSAVLCATALCLGFLLLSPSAWADEDAEITVRTEDDRQIQRDDERRPSAMVTRVQTDDLFVRGQNLGDALSQVTGVYVRRDSSLGQPAHLSVRGGNPRQVVVELDGLRLSSPAGFGFDLGQMMTEGFASADVYRGSGAALYGSGAVTGAMRLNPQQASPEGWEARGRLIGGSFGTLGASASAGAAGEVGGLRLHGGYRRSSGDFSFVDDQGVAHDRVNNDHERFSGGGTAHLESESHRLRLTGLWENGDAGSPGLSEFQEAFSHARTSDYRGLATLRWDGRELVSTSNVEVDAYGTLGAQQRAYHYHNESGYLTNREFENTARQQTAAATGGVAVFIGDSHLARADVEGRLEGYQTTSISLEERDLGAARRTAAISIGDEWFLLEDRLSLIGAARAEAIAQTSDERDVTETTTRPILPAIGAIGRVHRRLEVRANLARTFRMPDFDELYLDTEAVRGDPDLDPEEAWTADLGVSLGHASDPVVVQVAYFHNVIDSMILFLPVSSYLFAAQNLSGVTSQGLETAARLELGKRAEISAGYTYTRAYLQRESIDGARPQLPHQPRHRVAVESTIDLSGPALWSGLTELYLVPAAHYRSRINLDNFGNLYNAPALRLDLGLTAEFGGGLEAGLHLQNLLNHQRAQDTLHRPLPGRAGFISVQWKGGQKE